VEYRRPQDEGEYGALSAILANAFVFGRDEARSVIEKAGDEQARALVHGGEIVAGFIRRPMGQWWGGRSVPMLGVAAVGVPPHARGSGVATTLMREAVREMHEGGFFLSVLFAATYALYRRAGYELAGHVQEISAAAVPLRGDHELPMRPACAEDEPALRALQSEFARERNGPLDRSDVMWTRQHEGRDVHVVESDRIDGFIAHQQHEKDGRVLLSVRDLVARNEAAARRLLGFIAQHKAQVHRAVWTGDSADPFVTLLPTRRYRISLRDQWMLRVVDLKKALEARGYPAGVRASIDLEVEDDLIESNNGRWTLDVEGGRGAVKEGGAGKLRTNARGLAPLYSGFLPPASLRRAGWLEADDETCAAAAAVFGGSAPYMSEQF